jgi:hypothetical protein
MLIRISLIVALIAGLAVAGLSFFQIKGKVDTLVTQRDTEHTGRVSAEGQRDEANKELDVKRAQLKKTEEELTSTKTERDAAVTEAAAATKKATDLTQTLEKTTSERDDARAYLARYKQSGFEPEQLLGLAKQMKGLQDTVEVVNEEKRILQRTLSKATNELARILQPEYHGPPLRADIKGTVVVSDPKFNFVVLDIGENQGLQEYGELLVSRNGKLVAKVRVREVQKDKAVANLVDGWILGDVMEGDVVTPAYPAS